MVGGVMDLDATLKARGVPPHWLAYVATPDCDATLNKVKQLGGDIKMPATDIPKVGRFGVFGDPQGAVIAAFTPLPNDMPRYEGPPRVQEWCWHELGTTDHRAAFEFYHSVFGWEKTDAMEMGPGQVYQMYGIGGQSIGGMSNLDPKMNRPPSWLHYIEVADVDRAAIQIPKLGGKVVTGPMDVPAGRMLVMADPQGAFVGLHTAKAH
jgi:predicted enzyme related to lactoylglutathione lyase